jgi:PAS domain S-box-containing protein
MDITERKQAEKAIQDSKLQLETALSSIADAVFISDAEGQFIEFNDAFAVYHRFKDKAECAKTFAEYPAILEVFMADCSLAPVEQRPVSRALGGEIVTNAEYILRRKDTNETWMGSYSFAPIRNADGAIVGSVVTARDITERKRAEKLLLESEEKLRNAFANAAIGFAITTPDGRFVDANPAYCKIVGFNLDELRAHGFQQMVHPDDVAANMALIKQLLSKQSNDFVIEKRYIRPNGVIVWVRKSASIVRNSKDEPQWLISLVEDISERKQAEEDIRLLTSDLEHRVIERTAELSSANNELNSFAYAVSHDLRAPLRAMSGFSQALQEDYGEQLPDEAKLYLDQINIASAKMSELIDGLLVLSRSTRGELQRDVIDLSALATNLLSEFKKNDPERQVAVQVEAGLQGLGDARMIDAVMRNLLENAWKYTGHTPAACIRVYAEEHDEMRYFCVADNGAGFDMAHANRLFQAFQRLHRQDEFPGIGIGLATVQRIIHRHGGTIEARGEIGKGAVFCFTLGGATST